ncbi:hypothetical protein [Micromonospora zhanjiangensis]|uniref:DUF4333 domain-containing protein n=1 Tax=Micromonospora zhanjiangensis TaxID=1522057 RepID=A0ABV8KGL3_9ACTN
MVLLVCGGLCGVGQLITNVVNQDDWEGLGQPVPASSLPASPKPTWLRPNIFGSGADEQIRYDLEQQVLSSAGVQKPTTSRCASQGLTADRAMTFDCTVTYAGQAVVFTVETTPAGSSVFEWKAKAPRTVITRDGLLAYVQRKYGNSDPSTASWSDLRCDEFPEIALVPTDQDLPQFCYAKGEGHQKTSRIRIRPDEGGEPGLLTEDQ